MWRRERAASLDPCLKTKLQFFFTEQTPEEAVSPHRNPLTVLLRRHGSRSAAPDGMDLISSW